MEAKTLKFEGRTLVEIDNMGVIYFYHVRNEDFQHLTHRVAQEIRLPYSFAVCRSKESITGIAIYGRYGDKWYAISNYHEFIIKKLLNESNNK